MSAGPPTVLSRGRAVAQSAREAVIGADLICTVTASSLPVVDGDWLAEGAHLNVVGSSSPVAREVDTAAVVRSRLFVDRRESAENESGDYLIPLAEGAISPDHILGELGDVLLGTLPGRTSGDDVTMFKSLGIAVEDLAAAHHVLGKAEARDRPGDRARWPAPFGGRRLTADHMSARVNPFFTPGVFPDPPREDVRAFHRSLPGYAATPLLFCPGLAASLGLGAVYLKDEGQRFGLEAFKALGASWALHQIRSGRSAPMTVSSATDGNHGRAVAWAARQLGLPAVIFIPAHAAPARVAKIRREGARVELVHGTYDDAVRRCADESDRNGWQVVADVGYEGYLDIPNQIVEGYATLFQEIDEQLEAAGRPAPNLVVVQAGVGSLLHAAVSHYRARAEQPTMVAVEPVQSDPLFASINTEDGRPAPSLGRQDSIMAGLNCGSVSLAAWPTVRRGVELFMTVTDRFAMEAMRRLARPAGRIRRSWPANRGPRAWPDCWRCLQAPGASPVQRSFLRLGPATRLLVINTEGATDPEGYRRVVEEYDSGLR